MDGEPISGYALATTNNRMELTAVIRGLEATPVGSQVRVFTDSQYVANHLVSLQAWQRARWQRGKGYHKRSIPNADLWQQLLEVSQRRKVQMVWVRGHNGVPENERVDQLAGRESQRAAEQLRELQAGDEPCQPMLSDFNMPVDF